MKIVVTGGSGLVGKAIQQISKNYKHNFTFIGSKDCNLLDYSQLLNFLKENKPDLVIHLAAMVGGLFKNMKYPVEMFEKNILMNTNLLRACHECNIDNVISCLSTCIFPNEIKYPINETSLHDGKPHDSNFAYAYAKRMLEIQSRCYREQYKRNYICIIPTNIYGPYDNFSLTDGHVIPSLIHKCYLAKKENKDFEVKGSGKPLRQFIYSIDLAKIILNLCENCRGDNLIISSYEEISIEDISKIIASKFKYQNRIVFNTNYSDGQFKKTVDNKKLVDLIPKLKFTNIEDGINETIDWFLENYNSIRK